jgi:hypothetical protein
MVRPHNLPKQTGWRREPAPQARLGEQAAVAGPSGQATTSRLSISPDSRFGAMTFAPCSRRPASQQFPTPRKGMQTCDKGGPHDMTCWNGSVEKTFHQVRALPGLIRRIATTPRPSGSSLVQLVFIRASCLSCILAACKQYCVTYPLGSASQERGLRLELGLQGFAIRATFVPPWIDVDGEQFSMLSCPAPQGCLQNYHPVITAPLLSRICLSRKRHHQKGWQRIALATATVHKGERKFSIVVAWKWNLSTPYAQRSDDFSTRLRTRKLGCDASDILEAFSCKSILQFTGNCCLS